MADVWFYVPLAWAAAFAVAVWAYYRHKTAIATAPSGDFQRLAADALRAQQEMNETLGRMVGSLKEIERVLTEV